MGKQQQPKPTFVETTAYQEKNADIIAKAQEGDRRAQYQLYQDYASAMFHTALRLMGRNEEAEEALQDAFLQAFRKLGEYRGEAAFGAWLKRIVVRTCLNALQKKQWEWSPLPPASLQIAEESEKDQDALILQVQKVQNAVQQLPDGFRLVLSLYLFEGYDHEEIADILQISASTSKSQYSRAKKKLREILTVR
ncbi:RNA polymerase sigma factor [Hugenholtzia roseola]|uniref:RNA polymerase sigma factor n=1 Tax=Hugenholtzia roseola TaxID=1002 RepID=UPI0004096659|nr:sigma-70 family RNA polymerase sigma factor [Hugenholtzia roseola]